jgi:hypothetical protein
MRAAAPRIGISASPEADVTGMVTGAVTGMVTGPGTGMVTGAATSPPACFSAGGAAFPASTGATARPLPPRVSSNTCFQLSSTAARSCRYSW